MIKKRLTQLEIKKIRSLVESGTSLKIISNIIHKSKCTIYPYFRKFKGRTYFPIRIETDKHESMGEMLGIFASDGNYFKTKDYHHRVFFFFGPLEIERMEEVKLMLTLLLNKKPIQAKRDNLLILYYCSKLLITFIQKYLDWIPGKKTYSVKLKNKKFCRHFIKGFIRGCFDSDGYISKKQISFSSVSSDLVSDISKSLHTLHIKHTITCYQDKRPNRKLIHRAHILKADSKKFMRLIKPRKRMK